MLPDFPYVDYGSFGLSFGLFVSVFHISCLFFYACMCKNEVLGRWLKALCMWMGFENWWVLLLGDMVIRLNFHWCVCV